MARKGWKAWVQLTKAEADSKAKRLRGLGYKVRRIKVSQGNYLLYYGKE